MAERAKRLASAFRNDDDRERLLKYAAELEARADALQGTAPR
jgi:hypothetical protein